MNFAHVSVVEVKEAYDDGWALGVNLTTKQPGIFPLICLNRRSYHKPSRISSLYKIEPTRM